MNIRQIVNRTRIRRELHSQTKLREVVRKVQWLEFENNSILNFLTKYNILTKGRVNSPFGSEDIVTKEDTNINQQPKFDLTIIEL